jgi:cytochrome P450
MFIVGVDTAANAMGWVMAELLANPGEMRKVQEELAAAVGMRRMVEDGDLDGLAYLRAVIKEALRLHPVATMMIPHVSSEDCEVEVAAGDTVHRYNVRSGTTVFINLWAIGRDPRVWDKPDAFAPARFLAGGSSSGVDLRGQHFELIPFGSGRRMCPGMNLGLRVIELVLANLLHCFCWSPSTAGVDLSETTSARTRALTLAKPLLALPTFRLQKAWTHVEHCSDS